MSAGFGITVTRPLTGRWVVNHGSPDAEGFRTWRDAYDEAERRAQRKRQTFRLLGPQRVSNGGQS